MTVRVGVLVVAVGLLAGCTAADGGGRDYNPAHQPRYVVPDPTGARPGGSSHVIRGGTVSSGTDQAATFSLVSGADVVRVTVGDLGTDLFEASTPAESKAVPEADVSGTNVVLGLRESGRGGPTVVSVVLSDDMRWGVRLSGGAGDQSVDLRGGLGGDVDFSAGTSRAGVSLPAAKGTQRVVLAGGAGQLTVNLTGGAPVRVAARGGAGAVTVDGQTKSGVPGGTVYTAPGWDSAPDRFDIDATSGVSTITVARG